MSDSVVIERASQFIAKWEGLRTRAYWDTGAWAICFGSRGRKGQVVSEEVCHQMLKRDVSIAYNVATRSFPDQDMTENQLIALTSLFYNVKYSSTVHLRWRIGTGQSETSIRNAWMALHKAGGVTLNGLKKRRSAEVNLFYQ